MSLLSHLNPSHQTEQSKLVLKSSSEQQADQIKSSQQKAHQNNCNQFLTLPVVELPDGLESLDHGQCSGSTECIHAGPVHTLVRPDLKFELCTQGKPFILSRIRGIPNPNKSLHEPGNQLPQKALQGLSPASSLQLQPGLNSSEPLCLPPLLCHINTPRVRGQGNCTGCRNQHQNRKE